VVPEKQGLKQGAEIFVGNIDGRLSSGSRKTRIETTSMSESSASE